MALTRTSSRSPIKLEILLLACAACGHSPAKGPSGASAVELVAPGVLSTDGNELNSAFTPDGKTVYLTRASADFEQNSIYESHLVDGKWSPPQLAPFSSADGNDGDPFVSPDGQKLFFMSKRAVSGGAPRKDWDLWVVERAPAGGSRWGEPRHLGAAVNAGGEEYYPVVTRDGTLYFASDRAGGLGETDLYRSRLVGGEYQAPENLGPTVNGPGFEHDAWVDPEEKLMIFIVRDPPGGLGGADLFISHRSGDGWGPRRLLPAPINSKNWDFCPWVTPDGKWLYFTSSRGGKGGDIYRVPMEVVLRSGTS